MPLAGGKGAWCPAPLSAHQALSFGPRLETEGLYLSIESHCRVSHRVAMSLITIKQRCIWLSGGNYLRLLQLSDMVWWMHHLSSSQKTSGGK